MATLLRTLSLSTRLMGPRQAVGAVWGRTAATATTRMVPSIFGGGVSGLVHQTRGMKVHSSVKKRCEHCKVCSARVWWLNGGEGLLTGLGRLFDERLGNDTTDGCTSSAKRTRDTSNDRVRRMREELGCRKGCTILAQCGESRRDACGQRGTMDTEGLRRNT